jgi:membrane protein required for beta-lactamase induction
VPRPAAAGPVGLALDASTGRLARGERRQVLVLIEDADGVEALDLRLSYPGARLAIVGVQPVGIGAGMASAWNDTGGQLRLGLYGVEPLAGSGSLVAITVEARRGLSRLPPLRIEGSANEGTIPVQLAPARLKPPGR